jgi:ribosomal protein L11 methyltransferase
MPWLALTLQLERAAAEAFSDALLEAGAQSVSLETAGAVTALLSMEDDSKTLVARAARAAGIAPPAYSVETLDDQDWVRASQAQFAPLMIGERLWIGPGWHQPPAGRIAVRIDPGLAFGTGSHPSTRLVLGFLEAAIAGGERVLDYGCGSGILAIAAAKLGAARVDAVDLDPQAVETTRANAADNRVELNCALPDALPAADYDIVVSNILAQPLIVLAPLLATRAARIALSGILEGQAAEVAHAYARWLRMQTAEIDEGWALLVGERR